MNCESVPESWEPLVKQAVYVTLAFLQIFAVFWTLYTDSSIPWGSREKPTRMVGKTVKAFGSFMLEQGLALSSGLTVIIGIW